MLRLVRADAVRIANEFALPFGDPYMLGTQEKKSRPYNPTQLGKDFAAFCKMNGFKCTSRDLGHAFATMMIAGGCDARAAASWMRHASVSTTLDIYGDAVMGGSIGTPERREPALSFSVGQLEAMLAAAEEKNTSHGRLQARLALRALALPCRLALYVNGWNALICSL